MSMHKIVFLFVILQGSSSAFAQIDLPSRGLRDTALKMLREFVIDGGDDRLGFTKENVKRAKIDNERAMSFLTVLEDSIMVSERKEVFLVSINKVFYPVTADRRVCGSIAFGRNESGWHIREFQDSSEINTYIHTMARLQNFGNKYLLAYLPSLNHFVILNESKNTVTVTSPNILDPEEANDFYPESVEFLNKPELPLAEFVHGYREHLIHEAEAQK
jgi:hypothetical protein